MNDHRQRQEEYSNRQPQMTDDDWARFAARCVFVVMVLAAYVMVALLASGGLQ